MKIECHSCHHTEDNDQPKNLFFAFGPKAEDGLQRYLVYCRICKHLSVLKPGWFGNKKLQEILSPEQNFGPMFCWWKAVAWDQPVLLIPEAEVRRRLIYMEMALKEDGFLDHIKK